jgi:Fe-only nitrogenase accessory protein AnfO
MAFDIAVYLGEKGETTSLNNPGKLVVYRKRQGRWKACREKEFTTDPVEGMSGLRRMMGEVLEVMGECMIFVGHTVTGIPYFELEKANCMVWEMQGKPGEFLDIILDREEQEQRREEKGSLLVIPEPVEVGEGRYRVSIKEIQGCGGGITSKQVLQPFLRRGEFYELEVACSHVPPWLEAEFTAGSLNGEVSSSTPGEIKLVVTKKCCQT